MLLALLPSRDTPQARRSSSSDTQRPKWASTMARAAAPHSTASIWRMVGVRAGFAGASAPRRKMRPEILPASPRSSTSDPQLLPHLGDDQPDRPLGAHHDRARRERAAADRHLRAARGGPAVAGRRA